MKLFISWSGEKSRKLAEIIRNWIPSVIQAVEPYFSPDDIDKGAIWYSEISKELENSNVGIICLTNENYEAPWILFEAGALAKTFTKSRVIPILFGLRPTDIKAPLSQFQCATFGKNEMSKVIKSINKALGNTALNSNILEKVYEKWWPDLESQVFEVMKNEDPKNKFEIRSDREILEEVLTITRSINTEIDNTINKPKYSIIPELELSVRAIVELKKANILKLGDLVKHTESELNKKYKLSKMSIRRIKEELAFLGLKLGMKVEA